MPRCKIPRHSVTTTTPPIIYKCNPFRLRWCNWFCVDKKTVGKKENPHWFIQQIVLIIKMSAFTEIDGWLELIKLNCVFSLISLSLSLSVFPPRWPVRSMILKQTSASIIKMRWTIKLKIKLISWGETKVTVPSDVTLLSGGVQKQTRQDKTRQNVLFKCPKPQTQNNTLQVVLQNNTPFNIVELFRLN